MENLRITVTLPDHQLAKLAIRVLDTELSNNISEDKEDVFLRGKINTAKSALEATLNNCWLEPIAHISTSPQIKAAFCIEEYMIINLTLQTLSVKIAKESKSSNNIYLRQLVCTRNALQEVMIDLWNEDPIPKRSVAVIK